MSEFTGPRLFEDAKQQRVDRATELLRIWLDDAPTPTERDRRKRWLYACAGWRCLVCGSDLVQTRDGLVCSSGSH